MFKKLIVIGMAVLLPVMAMAGSDTKQEQKMVDPKDVGGGGFVIYQFMSLKPINDFLSKLNPNPDFDAYPDNMMFFGGAFGIKPMDNFTCGVKFATTLGGLDILEPNILSREKARGGAANNLVELSVMFGELTFDYKFVRIGGFYINGGCGIGLGGSRLTLYGDDGAGGGKNGKFGMLSMLVDPKFGVGYVFEQEACKGMAISINGGYSYFPGCVNGWWKEAGNVSAPGVFDMSGWYISAGVNMPVKDWSDMGKSALPPVTNSQN